MACRPCGANHYLNQLWSIVNWAFKTICSEIWIVLVDFHSLKCIWKRPNNVSSCLAIYDVKLGLREDFSNHTYTLWQCVWINRMQQYLFYMCYVFLDAVIFTYIESGSIVINFNGNWLTISVTICDIWNEILISLISKISFMYFQNHFIVYIRNYKINKIAIADVRKWLEIW